MAANLSSIAVVLTLPRIPWGACSDRSLGSTTEFLSQQVWAGTQAFAFVTSSQMMPKLTV